MIYLNEPEHWVKTWLELPRADQSKIGIKAQYFNCLSPTIIIPDFFDRFSNSHKCFIALKTGTLRLTEIPTEVVNTQVFFRVCFSESNSPLEYLHYLSRIIFYIR